MIDISVFNEFYTFKEQKEDGSPFDVSDEVKHTYYIFIKDFCPMVSSHWKKYLSKLCKNRETASFVNQLTRSDEAFSYWLMVCLIKKVEADHKFINENGLKEWSEKRKKGKGGKHDSNVRFDEFIKIFQKIDQLRNNERAYSFWMNIFFDQFFKDYQTKPIEMEDDTVGREAASNKTVEIPTSFD